ncbi:MAG: cation:proton antiporter [Chloroflexi bacterium]|nr:cation:proton antiporter [Chloroflexota bacterium]
MDAALIFSVVAGIIIIGFAGEIFFKKSGVPIFIFLIFTGILLGPVLNVFPREPLLPSLSIFAELTLLMVLFYGGMGLKPASILAGGSRAIIQTLLYVLCSTALIGAVGIYVLNWGVLPSLIFASMIGGETTAAVVVPLSRAMKLGETTVAFLTLESAINSIFSIVLFSAFVGIYTANGGGWFTALSNIASQFSVGIVLGCLLSFVWVYLLFRFQHQKFTYVLTLGFVLITFAVTNYLGGNGVLAVLVFGIILGNYYLVKKLLRKDMNMDSIQKQLGGFHEEISFLMETLFFVFLGLTFVINPSTVIGNLSIGLLVLALLLVVRFAATTASTYNSSLHNDRKIILFMCSQGLTPATLAVLAVSLNLPLADTFLNIVTYVIILTNVVTTIGSVLFRRNQNHTLLTSKEGVTIG